MRGYPFSSYFPSGKTPEKFASLGHANRWVRCETAVQGGNALPILLVSEKEFMADDGNPAALTIHFDGKAYGFNRRDTITRRFIYSLVPAAADVQEGQERVDGPVNPVGRINPNTVDNWPTGGDRPELTEQEVSELREGSLTVTSSQVETAEFDPRH